MNADLFYVCLFAQLIFFKPSQSAHLMGRKVGNRKTKN